MTALALIIAVIVLVLLALLFVRSLLREDKLRSELDEARAVASFERKMVRLHLQGTDPSLEGVLLEPPGAFYRLAQAVVHSEEDQSHAVEGEAWVERDRVLFVQVISG